MSKTKAVATKICISVCEMANLTNWLLCITIRKYNIMQGSLYVTILFSLCICIIIKIFHINSNTAQFTNIYLGPTTVTQLHALHNAHTIFVIGMYTHVEKLHSTQTVNKGISNQPTLQTHDKLRVKCVMHFPCFYLNCIQWDSCTTNY